MSEVGFATLGIIPSFDGFRRRLESGSSRAMLAAGTSGGTRFGDAAGKSAGSRFGSVFKTAAKASLIGLAGAGALAFKFGGDAVSAASDLEESTNKVQQIFGGNSDAIFKFSERAADALGQTNTQAREAAATFGIFAGAAGLSDQKSAKFAKRMTRLASDLASFNNTEPDEAVQALGAALRGESEPIRKYGVLLDEATLKAEALRLGILKPVKDKSKILAYQTNVTLAQKAYNDAVEEGGPKSLEALKAQAALGTAQSSLQKATEGVLPPLTQQQKLLAAQSQIFKQTEVAQGDFARTSDGLANQQRRLSARFEDAKAKLGAGLLPIMTEAADFLLDKGIPAFEDFSDWFVDKGIPKLKEFGDFVKDDVAPVLSDLVDFAGDAAGAVGDLIGFLNKMPGPAKLAGLAAILAGGGALKLRGGKGGLLGTAGSALGLAKPVPVFVTNQGFGTGTGGTGGTAGTKAGKFGKMVPIIGTGGTILGFTALAAGAATVGIHGLGERFAPEQTARGNFGTPQGGPGAILDFGDGEEEGGKFGSSFGAAFSSAFTNSLVASVDKAEFELLPKTLQTRFELLGVPETEGALRKVLNAYDLTPKQKTTTLELLGYEPMLDRIARINRELDWAARPREARIKITKSYAAAGYQTYGGLQEGMTNDSSHTRSRRRGAGGV